MQQTLLFAAPAENEQSGGVATALQIESRQFFNNPFETVLGKPV